MFAGVLFFADAVACALKKNEALTFYQISRVAAVELAPRWGVEQVLFMNLYYQERNTLATQCHQRTGRKRIARRRMDLRKVYRCKWT